MADTLKTANEVFSAISFVSATYMWFYGVVVIALIAFPDATFNLADALYPSRADILQVDFHDLEQQYGVSVYGTPMVPVSFLIVYGLSQTVESFLTGVSEGRTAETPASNLPSIYHERFLQVTFRAGVVCVLLLVATVIAAQVLGSSADLHPVIQVVSVLTVVPIRLLGGELLLAFAASLFLGGWYLSRDSPARLVYGGLGIWGLFVLFALGLVVLKNVFGIALLVLLVYPIYLGLRALIHGGRESG